MEISVMVNKTRASFTVAQGEKVGDVSLDAGEYTLDDIVRIVNEKSRQFSAREDADKVLLKPKYHLATKHLTTEPPTPRNRHERRKAEALSRRRS